MTTLSHTRWSVRPFPRIPPKPYLKFLLPTSRTLIIVGKCTASCLQGYMLRTATSFHPTTSGAIGGCVRFPAGPVFLPVSVQWSGFPNRPGLLKPSFYPTADWRLQWAADSASRAKCRASWPLCCWPRGLDGRHIGAARIRGNGSNGHTAQAVGELQDLPDSQAAVM